MVRLADADPSESDQTMKGKKTICVAGASGLVGSNIVRAALERGYVVHGTMRNLDAPGKASYLNALPNASTNLELFKADMSEPGGFDRALTGTDGVFIACLIPTYAGPSGKPPDGAGVGLGRVGARRFELRTSSLSATRSNQLSYAPRVRSNLF